MEKIIKLEKLEFRFNFDDTGTDAVTCEIGGVELLEWVTKSGYVEYQDSHLTICQSEALESLGMDFDDQYVIRELMQDFLNTNADAIKAIAWHEENPVAHINFNAEY